MKNEKVVLQEIIDDLIVRHQKIYAESKKYYAEGNQNEIKKCVSIADELEKIIEAYQIRRSEVEVCEGDENK